METTSDKTINKSELILQLSKNHNISIEVATLALETFFNEITQSLQKGKNVQLRGFGSFELRSYKSYKGKNPKDNTIIHVKAKKAPFFKTGSIKDEL